MLPTIKDKKEQNAKNSSDNKSIIQGVFNSMRNSNRTAHEQALKITPNDDFFKNNVTKSLSKIVSLLEVIKNRLDGKKEDGGLLAGLGGLLASLLNPLKKGGVLGNLLKGLGSLGGLLLGKNFLDKLRGKPATPRVTPKPKGQVKGFLSRLFGGLRSGFNKLFGSSFATSIAKSLKTALKTGAVALGAKKLYDVAKATAPKLAARNPKIATAAALATGAALKSKTIATSFKSLNPFKSKSLANNSIGKAASSSTASNVASKIAGKGALKAGAKLVPGLGLALGAGFAINRASKGDYVGAAGEVVSGIASMIPGIGTAAALAIQGGLIARDMTKSSVKENEKVIKSTKKSIQLTNNNATIMSFIQRSTLDKFTLGLGGLISITKTSMLDGTNKMLSSIRDFIPKIFDGVGSGVKSMFNTISSFSTKILDTIKGSVSAIVKWAASPLTAIINKIQSMLPSWLGGSDGTDDGSGGSATTGTGATPSASAKQNFEKVKGNLKAAANKFGVDAGLLAKITYFESGRSFNPNAAPVSSTASRNTVYNTGAGRKAMSSAHGLGQFIDTTWYGTLRRHGGTMGIGTNLSEKQMDALRRDPNIQSLAMAALTKDNLAASASISGGDRVADVYVMHNLGSGSGPKFLRALKSNPNTPVRNVLSGKEISNNPSLYGNGSISVSAAYNKMRQLMADGNEFAQAIGGAVPSSTNLITPATTKSSSNNKSNNSLVNTVSGIVKVASPTNVLSSISKSKQSNKTGSGVLKTTTQTPKINLKMPVGNKFLPDNYSQDNQEFDFSDLSDPNYKVKKMGLIDSIKYAIGGSDSNLVTNLTTTEKKKQENIKNVLDKNNLIKNGKVNKGVIAVTGTGSIIKDAPKIATGIARVATAVPKVISGVFNDKSSTKTQKIDNMDGRGVRKTSTNNMNGQGVLKSTTKTPTKTNVYTGAIYSTAQDNVAYDDTDYSLPNMVVDNIGQTAESMLQGNTRSFGRCIRGVWFILGNAGIPGFPKTSSRSNNANNWGSVGIAKARDAAPALIEKGFTEITAGASPKNGDVDVLGPRIGQGTAHAGHIQVYANGKWYSDHIQGRRYGTDRYAWVKTFRFAAAMSAANSVSGVTNNEPIMPSDEPDISMGDKLVNAINSVFTTENLNGLREIMQPVADDVIAQSPELNTGITKFQRTNESFYRDYKFGENKNGTISENLKKVLQGSIERQLPDSTGINKTTGFTMNPDRQEEDKTGINKTPGFTMNPDRQEEDKTGINKTPGFTMNPDRQGSFSSKIKKRFGWLRGLFDGELGNILNGIFPGLSDIFGMLETGDYAGVLMGVLNGIENKNKINDTPLIMGGGFGGGLNDINLPDDNQNVYTIPDNGLSTNNFPYDNEPDTIYIDDNNQMYDNGYVFLPQQNDKSSYILGTGFENSFLKSNFMVTGNNVPLQSIDYIDSDYINRNNELYKANKGNPYHTVYKDGDKASSLFESDIILPNDSYNKDMTSLYKTELGNPYHTVYKDGDKASSLFESDDLNKINFRSLVHRLDDGNPYKTDYFYNDKNLSDLEKEAAKNDSDNKSKQTVYRIDDGYGNFYNTVYMNGDKPYNFGGSKTKKLNQNNPYETIYKTSDKFDTVINNSPYGYSIDPILINGGGFGGGLTNDSRYGSSNKSEQYRIIDNNQNVYDENGNYVESTNSDYIDYQYDSNTGTFSIDPTKVNNEFGGFDNNSSRQGDYNVDPTLINGGGFGGYDKSNEGIFNLGGFSIGGFGGGIFDSDSGFNKGPGTFGILTSVLDAISNTNSYGNMVFGEANNERFFNKNLISNFVDSNNDIMGSIGSVLSNGGIGEIGGMVGNVISTIKEGNFKDNIKGNLKGVLSNVLSSAGSTGIMPTMGDSSDILSHLSDMQFNNSMMKNMQSQYQPPQTIVQQPNVMPSHMTGGNTDGAVLPITVRNNDSIIREIAKDYLKNSL